MISSLKLELLYVKGNYYQGSLSNIFPYYKPKEEHWCGAWQSTAYFLHSLLFTEGSAHIECVEYWKHYAVKSDFAYFPSEVRWLLKVVCSETQECILFLQAFLK